jgi:hypothetical protein
VQPENFVIGQLEFHLQLWRCTVPLALIVQVVLLLLVLLALIPFIPLLVSSHVPQYQQDQTILMQIHHP